MDGLTLIVVICILLIGGSVAGTFAGFLGIGGAFILIPFQFHILMELGFPPDISMKTAIATTLCFTFPTAFNSAYNHSKKGTVIWNKAVIIGVSGFISSFIGAYIATFLSAAYLCVIFGVIVLTTSLKIKSAQNVSEGENKISENKIIYILFGMAAGLASGLVGIGGGLILIPLLILLLKFPVRKAVGLSSAAIVFTSAGGVCGYIINGIGVASPIPYSFGYINLVFWTALVIPGVIFSRFGASLSHKTDPKKIQYVFSIVSFLIGSFMIIRGITLWMY